MPSTLTVRCSLFFLAKTPTFVGMEAIMKKYRVREGSVIDYARVGLVGLMLFPGLVALAMF